MFLTELYIKYVRRESNPFGRVSCAYQCVTRAPYNPSRSTHTHKSHAMFIEWCLIVYDVIFFVFRVRCSPNEKQAKWRPKRSRDAGSGPFECHESLLTNPCQKVLQQPRIKVHWNRFEAEYGLGVVHSLHFSHWVIRSQNTSLFSTQRSTITSVSSNEMCITISC